MPYTAFHDLFPEVAERETRTVTVTDPSKFNLPPSQYAFIEMFCDEPGCDCRRVFFYVATSSRKDPLAVIAWGWEDRRFYAKWMGDSDPRVIDDLKGPALNLASPQSDLAPALLDIVQMLLRDRGYVERIKRHYAMFREKIDTEDRAAGRGKRKTPR